MCLKIIVVSDTHGNTDLLGRVIGASSPFDIIVHCGDGLKDIHRADVPENSVVLKVHGNTDSSFGFDADEILIEDILETTVMITHGHRFDVKTGLNGLLLQAKNLNAGVVIFGHTHKQFFHKGPPLLFNPGDLSGGNYGIIHASKDKEWIFEHRKIKRS